MSQETPNLNPTEPLALPEDNLARYEAVLAEHIFPELERGRPNYDRPHTISVVQKAKDILAHTSGITVDPAVVVVAAYAHDWGYSDLFANGEPTDLTLIRQQKPLHMKIGAEKLEQLLTDKAFATLTQEQKDRAVHLVRVHDRVEELSADDEKVLMEADTLDALDVSYLEPTFSSEDNAKYLAKTRSNRLPYFTTQYGKDTFESLIAGREQWYAERYTEEPQESIQ